MRKRGIKKKLGNNIKPIYELIRNYVKKDGEQSEEFVAMAGLRQGGDLSYILFIQSRIMLQKKSSQKSSRLVWDIHVWKRWVLGNVCLFTQVGIVVKPKISLNPRQVSKTKKETTLLLHIFSTTINLLQV